MVCMSDALAVFGDYRIGNVEMTGKIAESIVSLKKAPAAFKQEEVELSILRSLLVGGLLDEAHKLFLGHIL